MTQAEERTARLVRDQKLVAALLSPLVLTCPRDGKRLLLDSDGDYVCPRCAYFVIRLQVGGTPN